MPPTVYYVTMSERATDISKHRGTRYTCVRGAARRGAARRGTALSVAAY